MGRFGRSGARLAILAASIVGMVVVSLTSAFAVHNEQHEVTICHATGSDKNPYNAISTANPAVHEAHFPDHEDDFILDEPDQTDEDCERAAPGDDDTGGDDDDDGGEEYPPKDE